MRKFSLHLLSASALLLAMAGLAHAQSGPSIITTAKAGAIQTPMFTAPNVPNKVWRPRNWMEVDVDMQAKGIRGAGKGDFLDAVEVKVYVGFNAVDPVTKNHNAVSGTFTVQNLPEHSVEHSHLLVYIPPALLFRLLGKPDFTNGDIAGIGVVVSYGGNVVGGFPLGGAKWWESPKVTIQDGLLLPKVKTPFAPLWGDYDLEVK